MAWVAGINGQFTESQRHALALMYLGQTMTNGRYRQATGVDSRVATADLRELVDKKLVVKTNTTRWVTYALNPAGVEAAEPAVAHEADEDVRLGVVYEEIAHLGGQRAPAIAKAVGHPQRSVERDIASLVARRVQAFAPFAAGERSSAGDR